MATGLTGDASAATPWTCRTIWSVGDAAPSLAGPAARAAVVWRCGRQRHRDRRQRRHRRGCRQQHHRAHGHRRQRWHRRRGHRRRWRRRHHKHPSKPRRRRQRQPRRRRGGWRRRSWRRQTQQWRKRRHRWQRRRRRRGLLRPWRRERRPALTLINARDDGTGNGGGSCAHPAWWRLGNPETVGRPPGSLPQCGPTVVAGEATIGGFGPRARNRMGA